MRHVRHINCGERIRDARKSAGLTQVELAAKVGISQPTVSEIECGERGVPIPLLCRIADALALDWRYDGRLTFRSRG